MSNQIDGSNMNLNGGVPGHNYILSTPPMHHHHTHQQYQHHGYNSAQYNHHTSPYAYQTSPAPNNDTAMMPNAYTAHATATPTVAVHHQPSHFHHSPHTLNQHQQHHHTSPYTHSPYQHQQQQMHQIQSPQQQNYSYSNNNSYNASPSSAYYHQANYVKQPSTPTSIHHQNLAIQQQHGISSPKISQTPPQMTKPVVNNNSNLSLSSVGSNSNAAYLTLLGLADKFKRSGHHRQAIHCLEAILVLRPHVNSVKVEIEVRMHLARMYVQHAVLNANTTQIVIAHLDKAV